MKSRLRDRVAVVTGASRGIGKAIAEALGAQGCEVFVSGRARGDGDRTIDATARLVREAGGTGHAISCDHADDEQIAALFRQVADAAGRVDILVNNVFTIPSPPAASGGFWEHPLSIWDDMVGIGLRAHYVASWHAAPLLFESGSGAAIVNVSSPGGLGYHFSCAYGAGKAGLDRLTADMAIELAPKDVAAIALYPMNVATEYFRDLSESIGFDISEWQTPQFVGRAAAALLASGDLMRRTGTIQWVEDLAQEFDVFDEYGRRPPGYARRSELEPRGSTQKHSPPGL
jgi:dehydrogenase/reductase SDR family member 1